MEVLVLPTAADVARRAAEVVIEGLGAARRDEPVLGLATGSSPLGLYAELAAAVRAGRLDLTRARGFALDEYVGLPVGHPQSYREVLLREVCGPLGLDPGRLDVPDGSGRDEDELVAGAADYERRIAAAGGVDVQILGIGANGHLGFNEPGSALSSRTRVKRLSDRTRHDNARFFTGPEGVPTHCVTQGLGTVLAARRLVLVASGPAKADAVAAALEGPLSASCPASVLQWHADATAVLDEAAAARLRNRDYYDASAAGL
ncbi:glucosamine-6-phosphate deaminase [Terrabacter aerolatus]|uniref:Glucosamine-6-phosphate deaminase n=1 Tax=Terrabacter aerolatus TaxID=422442 RepID=A0A512D3U3_9MICO|nr:glucosamine-6-phosphate deaminase [Terrabacter aerolatus]GEO30940.1 glucosamine-6-phosphate deaminase [Terrabacter aerolatus]